MTASILAVLSAGAQGFNPLRIGESSMTRSPTTMSEVDGLVFQSPSNRGVIDDDSGEQATALVQNSFNPLRIGESSMTLRRETSRHG